MMAVLEGLDIGNQTPEAIKVFVELDDAAGAGDLDGHGTGIPFAGRRGGPLGPRKMR